jgi:hypothetical protein
MPLLHKTPLIVIRVIKLNSGLSVNLWITTEIIAADISIHIKGVPVWETLLEDRRREEEVNSSKARGSRRTWRIRNEELPPPYFSPVITRRTVWRWTRCNVGHRMTCMGKWETYSRFWSRNPKGYTTRETQVWLGQRWGLNWTVTGYNPVAALYECDS